MLLCEKKLIPGENMDVESRLGGWRRTVNQAAGYMAVLALLIALLLLAGCEVWRQAPIKVSVKNSTDLLLEICFNDECEKELLGPLEIKAYRPRVIVEGADYNDGYSFAPKQPECAKIHVTAQDVGSEAFVGTTSIRVCQDRETLIDVTTSGLIQLSSGVSTEFQ